MQSYELAGKGLFYCTEWDYTKIGNLANMSLSPIYQSSVYHLSTIHVHIFFCLPRIRNLGHIHYRWNKEIALSLHVRLIVRFRVCDSSPYIQWWSVIRIYNIRTIQIFLTRYFEVLWGIGKENLSTLFFLSLYFPLSFTDFVQSLKKQVVGSSGVLGMTRSF